MILSSADILRILGGSEIVRLSARLKVVDEKPVLSGEEHLYVCISRFPSVDEFQATWTVWIEGDGEEALVIEEIKRLLPSVKVNDGLITELTTTDFLSASTQRAPEAPALSNAQMGGHDYEERFQSLSEGIQDQMLLVNSGRNGLDGRDGRDGVDGRDGRDLVATDAGLFDLNDAEQGIQMERGQVLTWDGSSWTNLFVPQILSSGGGGTGGGTGDGQINSDTIVSENQPTERKDAKGALRDGDSWFRPSDNAFYVYSEGVWSRVSGTGGGGGGPCDGILDGGNADDGTSDGVDCGGGGIEEAPTDGRRYVRESAAWSALTPSDSGQGGIEEAPLDGNYYIRSDGKWLDMVSVLDALGYSRSDVLDGGDFTNVTTDATDDAVVDGGDFQ